MSLLIHEVSARANVSVDTIRRLEKRGLISSQRDCNNWRRYSPEAVKILRRLYIRDDQSPKSDGPEPKNAA